MADSSELAALGVQAAAIANGAVFLRMDARGTPAANLVLRLGRREAGLEPLDGPRSRAMDLAVGLRPAMPAQSAAAAAAPGGASPSAPARFDARVNALRDWSPPGLATLQVRVADRRVPRRIPAAEPLVVPASPEPLLFQAGVAAHRCRARLVVGLHRSVPPGEGDAIGPPWRSVRLELERGWAGGRSVEAFQPLRWVIPPRDDDALLTLHLDYEGFTAKDEHADPVMMLLDPRVTSLGQGETQGASPEPLDLLLPPPPERGGPWLTAPVPDLLAPGDELTLRADGGSEGGPGPREALLLAGVARTVRLREDKGHTLVLGASDPGPVVVRLDGEVIHRGPLAEAGTAIRVPARLLTGQVRRLDVVDPGGVQAFLASVVLLPRLVTPAEVLQADSAPPFPGALPPQAAHRFEALRRQLAAGLDAAAQRQVAWALEALETGPRQVELRPLRFPAHDAPEVSVVIPAHGHVETTYLALCSLLLAPNRTNFEVVLVDDASPDATATIEDLVEGIAVVRNERPQRFIRACNAGAARARGRFIALLNNDVEVTAGWLDELVDAFGRFDRVGLAGSKLVYPDGRLQEAGGIVWGSGNPWNYGRGQSPWDPRFCYSRQADYLSGAALLIPREVWDRVGGLSADFEPMYFEDTDLAFKVRAAGLTTWFVPSSVVVHHEGVTSGTDRGAGFKRFQEVNRPKFKRRWAAAYAAHGREGEAPDLEKDRGIAGRVLFIDHQPPRPDRDAGGFAAVQEMRLVQSLGYKVTFLPRNMAHLGRYTDDLGRMGIEQAFSPFHLSPADFLERRGAEFDAVYVTRHQVAQAVLDLVDRFAPQARILFNNADLHFLREMRAGLAAGDPEAVARARETREQELAVMRRAHAVLSYSDVEHAVIESHAEGGVTVVKAPWVVAAPAAVPGPEGRRGLSFLGNYNHPPNIEAVAWLAREVLPRLGAARPGLALHAYGAATPRALRDMAGPNLVVEGFVADVTQAYDGHRTFVAPLRSGAGIKGKVLGALAHGIPCVLSPLAAEGVGLRPGADCLVATTPEEWTEAILRLEEDDALWRALSGAGRAYVLDAFSFERARALMRRAFEAADLYPPAG